MPSQRIQTGSSFEFDSFWRPARADGGPEKAQGRLAYDPAKGIELAVIDLRPGGIRALEEPTEHSVLHGHDLNGRLCTLFDAIAVETEFNTAGGHVREVIQSNRLVYGAHLDSMDELEVRHVIVDVWGLTEWVNGIWSSAVEVRDPVSRSSRLWSWIRARLRFRRKREDPAELPEGEVLNIALDGAGLIIQRGTATRDGRPAHNRREAHVNTHFILDEPTTYHDFSERFIRPLQDLMTLTTGRQVEVDAVSVLILDEEEKWWDKEPLRIQKEVVIVERTRLDRPSDPEPPRAQLPMPLRAWGETAPTIIARWFRLRNELGGPGNLLFATLDKRDVSLEADVLNLLSVAEGYHRLRFDRPPFSDLAHQEVLSLVEGLAHAELRNHYVGKLRHANQLSQKRRIRALFDRAEPVLPQADSWRRKQLQPLIDTRNFLTHWGDPPDKILEDWDLWYALNRMRVILEVNLFLDLGIDHDTISSALGVAYHGREFMASA